MIPCVTFYVQERLICVRVSFTLPSDTGVANFILILGYDVLKKYSLFFDIFNAKLRFENNKQNMPD